jgi:hypothetical protein
MNERVDPPRLVGVPQPEFDESPSSWLARAALSQATSMQDLLNCLDLPTLDDLDFVVLSRRMPGALGVAGLGAMSLQVAGRVLFNLRKVNKDGRTYLLRNKNKLQYRYCAPCLLEQRQKYLPVHWRFKAWQWCPLHLSVMRDGCPRCSAPIELPTSMIRAGGQGEGVGSLDHCLRCGHRLASTADQDRGQVHPSAAGPWAQALMINGRALLAALYQGHLVATAGGARIHLATLRRMGALIPNNVGIWAPEIASGNDRTTLLPLDASDERAQSGALPPQALQSGSLVRESAYG